MAGCFNDLSSYLTTNHIRLAQFKQELVVSAAVGTLYNPQICSCPQTQRSS